MSQLNSILINLSQSILQIEQTNKLKISKLLLSSLDKQYFSQIILLDIKTFYQLYTKIQKYYQQRFQQQIIDSFFYDSQTQQKFICIYHLIFDLALNNTIDRKQEFLNAILEMNEQDKHILMQFVGQVVKRELFVKKQQIVQHQIIKKYAKIYNQEYQQLKILFNQMQKKYQDLQQSYQSLRQSYEIKHKQIKYLQNQKLQLLADLGLHLTSGYTQIGQKYKKDLNQYIRDTQRLCKQLQQHKSENLHKNIQMQELIKKFTKTQQQQQIHYKQKIYSLHNKQINTQKQLQKQSQKQAQYKFQIVRLKDAVVNLRKEIQNKNNQLNQQEKTIQKFNNMKKIHLQYRKQVIQNLRNIDVNTQNIRF